MNKQMGFSLFELIVVIGIIAILSGGVIYSFSKMQKSASLETTLTNIRNLLTQSRETVRKGNCKEMKFSFSPSEVRAKCLDVNTDPSAAVKDSFVAIPDNIIMAIINKTAPVQLIEFDLKNNGLGGLSLVPKGSILKPEDISFYITLTKQSENIKYPDQNSDQNNRLDQTKILYGPF